MLPCHRFAVVASLGLLISISNVFAAITIDGNWSEAEWGSYYRDTRDSWINGGNADGGWMRTARYSAVVDGYLAVAIVADKNFQTTYMTNGEEKPENAWKLRPFTGVNLYMYSGSSVAGTYGNDDDFIFEGNWLKYARPGTNGVWAENYLLANDLGQFYDGGVLVGSYFLNDNVYEARLSLNALRVSEKGYTSLRFGGQAYAYGFTYSSAPVPEPVTLAGIAFGLATLARRRQVR